MPSSGINNIFSVLKITGCENDTFSILTVKHATFYSLKMP